MNFNSAPRNNLESSTKRTKKETPSRFLFGVDIMINTYLSKINVSGKENLELIPKDKKVIIATSHISDIDMPVVIKALGKDFNIKVTGQSLNNETSAGKFSNAIIGSNNYIPIDYEMKNGAKEAKFNPDNFDTMASALNSGNEILIAAHNPSWGELPSGGLGAVYLNQLGTDYIILPVSVNVQSKEPFIEGKNNLKIINERPKANVSIGKPMQFDHITHISEYKKILEKRKRGENLTNDEREMFIEISRKLKEQSDELMRSIASFLPENKRGKYA